MIVHLPPETPLEVVGHALRKAFPLIERDAEERADRHELRKIDLKVALGK